MRINYNYHGKKYMFAFFESDGNDKITLVTDPGKDTEKLIPIKCNHANGISIRINIKSLSADNAAAGVMKFIRWSIYNDIATCYIDRIIEQFAF